MRRLLILALFLVASPAFAEEKVLVTAFRVTPAGMLSLGYEAADLLATSLPAGNVAIPKTLLVQELSLRGWTEPLSNEQLVTLARALGAKTFVRGAIQVSFPRSRQRVAKIETAMELVDASSDMSVGGIAPDPATMKVPAEETRQSEIVAEAVREILVKSAPRLVRASLATGKVLVVQQSGDIHLNIGNRQGIRRGTRLLVTRRIIDTATNAPTMMRVGEIIVHSTTEASAIARPATRNLNIQQLDNVTQVFEMRASKDLLTVLRS